MSARWENVPTGPHAIRDVCEADEEYRRLRREVDAREASRDLAWATANAANEIVAEARSRLNQRMFDLSMELGKAQLEAEKEAAK